MQQPPKGAAAMDPLLLMRECLDTAQTFKGRKGNWLHERIARVAAIDYGHARLRAMRPTLSQLRMIEAAIGCGLAGAAIEREARA